MVRGLKQDQTNSPTNLFFLCVVPAWLMYFSRCEFAWGKSGLLKHENIAVSVHLGLAVGGKFLACRDVMW